MLGQLLLNLKNAELQWDAFFLAIGVGLVCMSLMTSHAVGLYRQPLWVHRSYFLAGIFFIAVGALILQ